MNRMQMLTKLATIISTLSETGGSPESTLYIFFDMNLSDWEVARDVLLKSGTVKISNHFVTLTEQGLEIAKNLNRHITAQF